VSREELEELRYIYRVSEPQGKVKDTNKEKVRVTLSVVEESQQAVLDKLGYHLEVS